MGDKVELKINYSKENTHVENSYLITTKNGIENEVDWIIRCRNAARRPVTRSLSSYSREWSGHNNLYERGMYVDHTKDVDLEERLTVKDKILGLFLDIIWLIIGSYEEEDEGEKNG